MKHLVIPEGTQELEEYAFMRLSDLESVVLPDSLLRIPDMCFYMCQSLKEVRLPAGLLSIGTDAFARCESLQEIHFPDSLGAISSSAFEYCSSLTSIELPEKMTRVSPYTFRACTSLRSVRLPSHLVSLGDRAFSECTSLDSIEIPETLERIGYVPFASCTFVTAAGPRFTSRGGCLLSKDGRVIYHTCTGSDRICRVPDGAVIADTFCLEAGPAVEIYFPPSFCSCRLLLIHSDGDLRLVHADGLSLFDAECFLENNGYSFGLADSRLECSKCNMKTLRCLVRGFSAQLELGEPVDEAGISELRDAVLDRGLCFWSDRSCRTGLLQGGMIPPSSYLQCVSDSATEGDAEATAALLEYRERWLSQDKLERQEYLL